MRDYPTVDALIQGHWPHEPLGWGRFQQEITAMMKQLEALKAEVERLVSGINRQYTFNDGRIEEYEKKFLERDQEIAELKANAEESQMVASCLCGLNKEIDQLQRERDDDMRVENGRLRGRDEFKRLQIIEQSDTIRQLRAELKESYEHEAAVDEELDYLYESRSGKLLRKGKPFVVVANDETYFTAVYLTIREAEKAKGRWTDECEEEFQELTHYDDTDETPEPSPELQAARRRVLREYRARRELEDKYVSATVENAILRRQRDCLHNHCLVDDDVYAVLTEIDDEPD